MRRGLSAPCVVRAVTCGTKVVLQPPQLDLQLSVLGTELNQHRRWVLSIVTTPV